MCLATADARARPSARMVLCAASTDAGLRFYTSYLSRKARDVAENPNAAAVFYWPHSIARLASKARSHRTPRTSPTNIRCSPARPPHCRLGLGTERAARNVPDARGALSEFRRALRRRGSTSAALVGRLFVGAFANRVLAGPPQSHARSHALHALHRRLEGVTPPTLIAAEAREPVGKHPCRTGRREIVCV